MKEKNYEISAQYMRDLKKLLEKKKISKYDIAHASFRKNNAHWIIKSVNRVDLTVTYLNGDVLQLPTYPELIRRVKMANEDYKPARRKFIARYYKVINALTRHRARFKRAKNTIANALTPEQVKTLASKI